MAYLLEKNRFSAFCRIAIIIFFFFLGLLLAIGSASGLYQNALLLFSSSYGKAQDSAYILVDQFGYLPDDSKVAVISEHGQQGDLSDLNAVLIDSYQVINVRTDEIVYEGEAKPWKHGAVHNQSGDQASWFDFSSVRELGTYIIRNSRTNESSATFEISESVYQQLLPVATRMFYYQRSGFPKSLPYADARWTDDAAFLGPNQDSEAHFVDDKSNSSLVKDMRGGWFDAGDTNKYVTFAATAVHQLLDAYRENPRIWTDDFNLPESNNGIPDIIDEIVYELDWLKRMQDTDGGAFIKIGTLDYKMFERPSLDDRPRFYGPKCSSSTIDISAMFAHGALVFQDIEGYSDYSLDLQNRAITAWNWYENNPHSDQCDNQEIKSGDADKSLQEQDEISVASAIYLWALTNDSEYQNYIGSKIDLIKQCLYCHEAWYPYHVNFADALLYYIKLPDANNEIKEVLFDRLSRIASDSSSYVGGEDLDPYRSYMPDEQYHWGSNAIKALYGISNHDFYLIFSNSELNEKSKQRALDTLHYFHGINPLGLVYLSNMYDYGAEHSANEIHHDWFGHGIYDNALKSPSGPAPGYLTGGPNQNYSGDAPIDTQYPMRAYLDSNNKYHEMRMWEITEPAIYYQSAYLKLLSRLCG